MGEMSTLIPTMPVAFWKHLPTLEKELSEDGNLIILRTDTCSVLFSKRKHWDVDMLLEMRGHDTSTSEPRTIWAAGRYAGQMGRVHIWELKTFDQDKYMELKGA